MAFTPADLTIRLDAIGVTDHFLIAFSGGLDSTVLLHALARGAERLPSRAVHIHHGLHAQADAWAAHCQRICRELAVPIKLVRVDARGKSGESPEAAARRARYQAFLELVAPGVCLLTAHQQDDQAETLLLQLLRGSGPAGLAAMPEIASFGRGWHARPLLAYTRADLAAYAAAMGLQAIDDPSNRDLTFDRNFMRIEVVPRLRKRWPACASTLSRAARLQAQAHELLDELAEQDLIATAGSRAGTLSISGLKQLSKTRQRNLIRHWLIQLDLPVPSQRQLEHVLTDVVDSRWDSTAVVHWRGGEIRRYRGELYAMPPLARHDSKLAVEWRSPGPLHLPHLGITLERALLESLDLGTPLAGRAVTVRFRRGGERCRPRGRAHHRELKKLLQEAGVPPWERDRIPLIYIDGGLAVVVGYWVCDV